LGRQLAVVAYWNSLKCTAAKNRRICLLEEEEKGEEEEIVVVAAIVVVAVVVVVVVVHVNCNMSENERKLAGLRLFSKKAYGLVNASLRII
jgi:uncharacterized membrane protein